MKRTPPQPKKVITRSATNARHDSAPVLQTVDILSSYADNVFDSEPTKNIEQLFTFLSERFDFLKSQLDVANSNINILLEENREIKSEIKLICSIKNENAGNQVSNMGRMSYADQVKSSGPVIHIAPKDPRQKSEQTKEMIKNKIDPVSNQINGIRNAAKGAVVIECNNKESSEKFKNDAVKLLGDQYKIQAPKLRKPKIKICGISDKLYQ